jgi:hypothetical protein
MPNWVYNNLRIYGPTAEIERFLDIVKTKDSRFDFNTIIPTRDDDTDAWGNPWGTGPVFDLKIQEIKTLNFEAVVQLRFDTKWAPPIPVILEASKQFKELEFQMQYHEENGGPRAGEYRAKDGCDVHVDTSALNEWDYEMFMQGLKTPNQ